jgi:hypothetical protein
MRAGEDPSPATTPANKEAREKGFARLLTLLKQVDQQTAQVASPYADRSVAKQAKTAAPMSCGHGTVTADTANTNATAAIM